MLSKLVGWVVGREPVATATGIAAVVTALAGVLTAFDVVELSGEQIAALGALAAAVAGWAGRSRVTPLPRVPNSPEGGSVPLAVIIFVGILVVLAIGLGLCGDALFEDEDEVNDLGAPSLVLDHDCYEYGDCGGYDERNGGYGDGRGGDGRFGGGRSGDNDQRGNENCRNLCGNTIIVPAPGGGEQRAESLRCLVPFPYHCDPKPN